MRFKTNKFLKVDSPVIYKKTGELAIKNDTIELICKLPMAGEESKERSLRIAQLLMNADVLFDFLRKVSKEYNMPEEYKEAAKELINQFEV
nr:MAG TPA: hypothetical protein [Caudoviricetes sp.]